MQRFLTLILISCFLFGCQAGSTTTEPEIISHSYSPNKAPILNPERGFFIPYDLPGPVDFSSTRVSGSNLVHLNVLLEEWRETDIPQQVLDDLDASFAALRDSGLKTIIRFSYNQGSFPDSQPDASKAQILRHIQQLTPLLRNNSDVIAWVEAGFIGAWGEWHTSTNGLDNITDERDILNALLAALPDRYVQVRSPASIIGMFPNPADAANARVAHHNDCFLSSDTDWGTYEKDGKITMGLDQAYLTQLTRLTPMSGETCAPYPPRSECKNAIQEMELLHFSAINAVYNADVLRSWKEAGCINEIADRLGYRLYLISAGFNEQVRPGGLLNLKVDLTNSGFASLMNPRPVYVVLQGSNSVFMTKLEIDPRTWQPGSSSFSARVRIPSKITGGVYQLALWLPDEADTLQSNSLYAVQFANEGIWDRTTGYNVLGKIKIDPSTTGSYKDTDAMMVEQLISTQPSPASIIDGTNGDSNGGPTGASGTLTEGQK